MPKKLTQEEADKRIKRICKEKNYFLLENFEYKNSTSRLKLKCNIDGHIWNPMFYSFMKKGCPKCGGSLKRNKKETMNQIQNKCIEKNYILVEDFDYKNMRTTIKLKCNKDSYEWDVKIKYFLNNKYSGCSRCSNQEKYTQEQAEQIVSEYCKKNNFTYKSFIYKTNKTKFILKCNIDDYEWETTLSTIVQNKTGCSRCSGQEKYTQEQAESIIKQRCMENNFSYDNFIYKNNKTKIRLKCNVDDYEWETTFRNIMNNLFGCRRCSVQEKYTQEKVEENILNKCLERNYELVENFIYENNETKIKIKCIKHNHIWEVEYKEFMRNSGCPICKSSKGELIIKSYLDENNINYFHQKKFNNCKDKRVLPFDFYLPDYNICIEYDGRQHFESIEYFGGEKALNLIQYHDKIKNQYCLDNNIGLMRIKYDEKVMDKLYSIFN